MAEMSKTSKDISFSVNILIKKEDGLFVAHCLELDIVAVAETPDQSQREIIALVSAQIDCAFAHDNLHNLYSPAPREVWHEFFACKEQMERKYKLDSTFAEKEMSQVDIIPPWLIAKTCQPGRMCHA